MSTTKERLAVFIKEKGLSQAKFGEKAGLSPAFANTVGENISKATENKIKAAFPDLNTDWLLTGEGKMLKSDEATQRDIQISYSRPYTLNEFLKNYYSYLNCDEVEDSILGKQISDLSEEEISKVVEEMDLNYNDFVYGIEIVSRADKGGKLVPVFNANAAAGQTGGELSGAREGWINVGDMLKDSEGSLYVYGNSMIPGYPPGCLIGIRPLNETFIEPGNVYVIQTEANRYIKRLYYNDDETALLCVSDNHIKHTDGPLEGRYVYQPFHIRFSAIKIIYKVTGVIKRNSITSE